MIKEFISVIQLNRSNLQLWLWVALTYIVTAFLGQTFAIPPGNITPIWLPSGIMFALALKLGLRIWPGIFMGAFFGNIWAYFTLDDLSISIAAVSAATLNGLGDVIAISGVALLLQRLLNQKSPFNEISHFFIFVIIGAVSGSFVSATFGVTGLLLFGFIEPSNFLFSFSNWWVGDTVGILLLTPLIYSFFKDFKFIGVKNISYLLFCLGVYLFLFAHVFELTDLNLGILKVLILFSPIAFALMLFIGQQAIFLIQLLIVIIAIVATYQGNGPFVSYEYITPLMALQVFIGLFSMAVFAVALIVNQKQAMITKLSAQKMELESLYRHDQLTGLWNRYRIEEYLNIEIERSKRSGVCFSVYLIDIDDFKKVNDTFGHLEGDRILVELSQFLKVHSRSGDLVGRWGGEEFIIITMDSNQESSDEFASRIINKVNSQDFDLAQALTISIGYTLSKPEDTEEEILGRADKALYISKAQGKNQANFTK